MNCQEESYKLYKQGKTILEIASILKIDENQVKQNIIDAKLSQSLIYEPDEQSMLQNILLMQKEERLDFLQSVTVDMKKTITSEIAVFLKQEKINSEDISMVIWLIGELRIDDFNDYLKKLSFSYNGNIKRMAFSTM